jgi:hypothetical protein
VIMEALIPLITQQGLLQIIHLTNLPLAMVMVVEEGLLAPQDRMVALQDLQDILIILMDLMGILIAQLDPQDNLVEALQVLLEADLKVLLDLLDHLVLKAHKVPRDRKALLDLLVKEIELLNLTLSLD